MSGHLDDCLEQLEHKMVLVQLVFRSVLLLVDNLGRFDETANLLFDSPPPTNASTREGRKSLRRLSKSSFSTVTKMPITWAASFRCASWRK